MKRGGHRPRRKEGVGPYDDGGAVDGGRGDDPGDDDTEKCAEEAARTRQAGAEAQAPMKRRAQAVQQGAAVQARKGIMNLVAWKATPEARTLVRLRT